MAWYTYGTVAVYDAVTDTVRENATGGKFVLVKDGPAQPIRDLNGNTITEIKSNGSGQSTQFQCEQLYGLIQFGEVVVTVWANEAAALALSAPAAVTAAQAAQVAAQAAQAAAEAAVASIPDGPGGAVSSVAGKTGVVTLVKGDVGLGSVDNTADANKPVSTAQATALAGKASTTHGHVLTDIAGLQTALDSKQGINAPAALVAPVTKTADYTLTSTDHNKAIEIGSGTPLSITLPASATVGQVTEILRTGTGDVTIVGASGVTVDPVGGLALRAQFSAATVRCRAANRWHVAGDVVSAAPTLDPLELAPAYNVPVSTFGALGSTAAPTTAVDPAPTTAMWMREKRVGVAETTGTGGSAADLDLAASTRFLYYGFPSAPGTPIAAGAQVTNYVETQFMPGADAQFAYYPFGFATKFTGSVMQMRLNATSAAPFMGAVLVDGQLTTEAQYSATGLTSGSGAHWTLTFPDSRTRLIQVMNLQRGQGRFGGVAGNGTFTKPTETVKKVVVLGDSYVGGALTTGAADTLAKRLALLVAGRTPGTLLEIITLGIGSTGFVTALSGQPTSTFAGRVPFINSISPDALIIVGGRNDTTTTGLQAAVESLLDATSGISERYVVPSASNSTQSATRSAIAAGCASRGVFYADVNVDDIEKGGDGVHPTYAGHQAMASAAWSLIGAL